MCVCVCVWHEACRHVTAIVGGKPCVCVCVCVCVWHEACWHVTAIVGGRLGVWQAAAGRPASRV